MGAKRRASVAHPPAPPPAGLAADGPVFQGLVRGALPLFLLGLLDERPLHGVDMMRAIGAMTGGSWTPSPGSVYPILRGLERDGMIRGRWQRGPAAPRRVYRLTDVGRAGMPDLRRKLLAELTAAREVIDLHVTALQRMVRGMGHDE